MQLAKNVTRESNIVTDICCGASQNSPAVNSSLFIAREALAQKLPGSGITKAVVRPSGDKQAGNKLARRSPPPALEFPGIRAEQVATSPGRAGGAWLAPGALCSVGVSAAPG